MEYNKYYIIRKFGNFNLCSIQQAVRSSELDAKACCAKPVMQCVVFDGPISDIALF